MYKTLFSRRHEEGAGMKLVSFPEDTLGIFYRGKDEKNNTDKWNITYRLVKKEQGYAMRTIGSETPHIIDDKPLRGKDKKEAWLDAFRELARDISGLENSLPIMREDALAVWERLRQYHKEIYPE